VKTGKIRYAPPFDNKVKAETGGTRIRELHGRELLGCGRKG